MSPFFTFRKYFKRIKGSSRDPFLYLGITAVVLLSIVSTGPGLSSISLNTQGIFSSLEESFSEEPFIGPVKNASLGSPDFLFVENSSLKAVSPPVVITPQVLGMWMGEGDITERKEITEYIVEEGDSLWAIAARFDVSLDTILWANDIKSLLIKPGQKLLILPVTGVMHLVKEGDTVGSLAEKYKTDAEKIIEFNDLSGVGDIMINEVLIIPEGELPSVSIVQIPTASTGSSTNNFYGQSHAFPWGQCTWWVAQKRPIPAWGHAKDWLNNAIRSGYAVCKGSYCIPQVGAVISLSGNRYYGHVGYVEEVKGDKVVFSEMNYIGLGRMNYRTLRVGSSSIKGYIY